MLTVSRSFRIMITELPTSPRINRLVYPPIRTFDVTAPSIKVHDSDISHDLSYIFIHLLLSTFTINIRTSFIGL